MEHRWNARTPLNRRAVIEDRHMGAIPAAVHNMSPEGAWAHTGPLPLARYAAVVVHFPPGWDDGLDGCRFEGVVMHRSNEGIGIAFDELDTDTREALHAALLVNCSRVRAA
jgi:hypothetical protein